MNRVAVARWRPNRSVVWRTVAVVLDAAAVPVLRALVVDLVVGLVDGHVMAVAAAVGVELAGVGRRWVGRRPGPRASVVLHAGGQPVVVIRGDRDVVGLVPRLVGRVHPRRARGPVAVGVVDAAVVAEVDPLGRLIGRADRARVPGHRVLVGVHAVDAGPGLPAVERLAQADIGDEDVVLVAGIDPDAAEPPLVLALVVGVPGRLERVASVVGDEEPLVEPVGVPADDVDPVRVGRRDRDADPAEARVRGKPGLGAVIAGQRRGDVLQPGPGGPVVVGAVQARADAAVRPCRRITMVIPQRRVDPVGVGGVEGDVDAACGGVGRRQRELPGLAAVGGVVDAALRG